jgi:SAM-dependent methyltransferase
MGDANQLLFVQRNRARFKGPLLEVGSRDYGSTQDLRALFPGEVYVGTDLSPGKGVDAVGDLTAPFADVDKLLGGRRFGTIFCLSVLEHCAQPFRMAENLTGLLKPGGVLCVSVPFAWQFHGYPSDYWRFTHEGVRQLFPQIDFDLTQGGAFTSRPGDEQPLDTEIGVMRLSGKWHRQRGHPLRAVSVGLFKALRTMGLGRWLVGYPYILPPTMITMLGVKRLAGNV